jgi:hypothetical protein
MTQPTIMAPMVLGLRGPAGPSPTPFLSSAAAPFAMDRRYNQVRPANARSGYIDNGAGDLQSAGDWNTFTISVTAGGQVTLSHMLSASTGSYFSDVFGARLGNLSVGTGPVGNVLTFVPGGYQVAVPAGAAFLTLSVPAIYVQVNADTNLAFLRKFVAMTGTVTLGAAGLYDPVASGGMKRWAGRRAFVQGDSFWHNRDWPLALARDLGWASMVRAFRGGRQMSQGLTRTIYSIQDANGASTTTTKADTGPTDVGIAKADLSGIDVFVLALHTNDAAAGVPVGSYTDAPATFDANGAMTGGGATYFSRARGVIETLAGWNPRMEIVLGTPLYRTGVPLIADYQAAIETLADMYGCALAQVHRKVGVNPVTAATLLVDGTHMSDADFSLRMKPAWQDAFDRISPVEIAS